MLPGGVEVALWAVPEQYHTLVDRENGSFTLDATVLADLSSFFPSETNKIQYFYNINHTNCKLYVHIYTITKSFSISFHLIHFY